jgi:hypothetical protein
MTEKRAQRTGAVYGGEVTEGYAYALILIT